MLEVDTAGEDSVVNVVAYFCKGDTCEYWIYENEWKVNGKDTVKTLDVSTQVRLVVNDSTSKGYKMSYTFLDVKADSVGEHHEHDDATKDSYANDTYFNASLEKNGNYTISCEVVSVIPKETMKEVMGGLMGAITEGLKGKKTEDGKDHDGDIKDLDDEFKKEIDKAVDQDVQTSEYLSVTCFEDGWPWQAEAETHRGLPIRTVREMMNYFDLYSCRVSFIRSFRLSILLHHT